MRKILLIPVLAGLALGGCADMTDTQRTAATGAALGAASGALIGSFSGNAGWGALGGAAIGGAGGYLVSRNREARR
jgi:membrane associated rhomboid family serine protease